MGLAGETERLRRFWDERYREFSLRESGIISFDAATAALLYRCKRQAYLRAVRHLAPAAAAPRILDVGCGQGFFAEVAAERFPGCRYTGVDVSGKAVAYLRERHPAMTWRVADAGSDDLAAGGPSDIVQAIEVLHLILPDEHHRRALAAMCGAVAPGGLLVVTDVLPAARTAVNDYIVFRPLPAYAEVFREHRMSLESVFPMYYWLPDLAHPEHPLRRIFRVLGPRLVYALDRALLRLHAPQLFPSHDARMRMIVARRAEA